jgi:hypothetical protein
LVAAPQATDRLGPQADGRAKFPVGERRIDDVLELPAAPHIQWKDEAAFWAVEQRGVDLAQAQLTEEALLAEWREPRRLAEPGENLDYRVIQEGNANLERHRHARGVGIPKKALSQEQCLLQ